MANRLGMLVRKISGSAPVKIYYFIGWSADEKNILPTEGCTQPTKDTQSIAPRRPSTHNQHRGLRKTAWNNKCNQCKRWEKGAAWNRKGQEQEHCWKNFLAKKLAANRKGQKQEHHWKTCWRENFTQVMVEEKIMGSSLGRLHGTMAEGAPEPRTRIGNESPAPLKTFNIIKPKEEHP